MTDVAKPKGFKDLDVKELYRSALEDFALPVEPADADSRKVLEAAFLEGGVEWTDYVAQHPEIAPEPEPEQADGLLPGEHDTTTRITEPTRSEKPVTDRPLAAGEAPVEIIVAEPITAAPAQKWLVKMVRKNPVYEVKGYRFTQEHPYALVDPNMAEYLLTHEDGFRQATPLELREFYG